MILYSSFARFYARTRPRMVIEEICSRLEVSKEDKDAYFGRTLELLKTHNAK